MMIDNTTSVKDEVIDAGTDLFLALVATQGNILICAAAVAFFIVRVTLAARHKNSWCTAVALINKTIIAAMNGGDSVYICAAQSANIIYDCFTRKNSSGNRQT